jgi:hypothetical protein
MLSWLLAFALTAQAGTAGGVKIVVIAGEDAVNIIQQKTAVAPLVEIRDRNDQPVAGAVVLFALDRDSPATFSTGDRTLTVTTDGAGRATATGLTPTGKGSLRVNVTAKSGDQSATIAIAQTNVETAAEAAAVAGAGAAVAAGVAAGAGSGGLSAGAIAGIVAAAGGVALVAAKAAGGQSGGPSSGAPVSTISPPSGGSPPSSTPQRSTYVGPVTGQWVMTTTSTGGNVTGTCASTRAIAGTLTIILEQQADGSVAGSASTTGTQTEVGLTASPLCSPLGAAVPFARGGPVTGTSGNLSFRSETTANSLVSMSVITTSTFTGVVW